VRTISDGYRSNRWYTSQWANVLDLESDVAIAPDGWGPFDLVSGFARLEVRYECIYTGCGTTTYTRFGNRSRKGPARNWTNGHTSGLTGLAPSPDGRIYIHGDGTKLLGLLDNPLLDALRDFGGTNLEATFAPLLDDAFVFKETFGSLASSNSQLGPWRPESTVRANSSLATVQDPTLALPMRPQVPAPGMVQIPQGANGLYIPSAQSRQSLNNDDYGSMDLNYRQSDLEWNYGGGQDEHELKEAYVEFEMFESRLWVRAGKQNIVWGKTELFRTTDQFNPQDIALASLPSLEESRLGLWSARGVWSFYDVGPLEDVRFELAFNYDDFEPTDLGTCGEPYTVWLVCGKGGGAYAHGFTGLGIVGEIRPEDPWDDASGIEVGGRIEWRWDRFSFALTDFYGYADGFYLDSIAFYERAVDVRTGRPLAALATGGCDPNGLFGPPDTSGCLVASGTGPNNALDFHPSNRELFDLVCSATVGVASTVTEALADRCLVDVVNDNTIELISAFLFPDNPQPITNPLTQLTFSGFFSNLFVGNNGARNAAALLAGDPNLYLPINVDPCDGFLEDCTTPGPPPNAAYSASSPSLNQTLTVQQQALLGCGPFYGSNCEVDGIDLFNAEGSVMVQSFPQIEPDPPVATRFVNGQLIQLPGSNGPTQPGYSPNIDGCTGPDDPSIVGDEGCALSNGGAGANPLVNPLTGELFPNELAVFSYNFMIFLASLSLTDPDCDPDPTHPDCDPEQGDPDCVLSTAEGLIACGAERAAIAVTGTQRPEVRAAGNNRYGRRDWVWQGGGEVRLRYDKRNVLGLSIDFAEDVTKTNWGMEFTWIDDAITGSSTTKSLHQSADFFNLTISVDRPTFVNFLNQNRTLFFNSQWFVGYTKGYNDSFSGNGPMNVLATFTVATGYFQDRLLPSITFVTDFRSSSGGSIIQVGYRFTENFSAQVGSAIFYGTPQDSPISTHQLALGNNGGDFEAKTAYNGLSAISERDELFVSLRYTF
jgi:hypothetical protein